MAKDSVYNVLQKPVAEHGRNVFPLDNRHAYSMKAGQITPIKCIHFKPGDYFDMQAHDFSITFPMNTAAFLRGRKEFSFYSIYYNAVWSLFNQYMSTRQNPKSSAFGDDPYLQEPRIRIIDLLLSCVDQWAKLMWYTYRFDGDDFNQRQWLNAPYGIPHIYGAITSGGVTTYVDLRTIQSFTQLDSVVKGLFNRVYYANPFNIPVDAGTNGIKTRLYCLDAVGQFRAYNWLRKLDMLGYGNYYPFFSAAEKRISELDYTDDTSILEDFCEVVLELALDLIDTTTQYTGTFNSNFVITAEKTYNLYPICAYNACFYHFFRNSYYDNDYYSHNYNLDFVSVAKTHSQYNLLLCSDFDLRLLDIEYHQWKKDRFTGVLPDQQFGAVSSISISNVIPIIGDNSNLNGTTNMSVAQLGSQNTPAGQIRLTASGTTTPLSKLNAVGLSAFDVVALKRAEMLQDYRQQLMRAGNKTTDIFKALYGKECSSEHVDDIIPRFLDTFGEDIFVDPVTATADTGSQNPNGSLGDLSARAKFSGSSGRVKFNAGGDFGLILCLAYVVPTAEYNSYVVDKHLMELTPEAHFIPQFENLGLEDIYNFELNCLLPYNSVQSLGKVPRYHHKKGEIDQVHGAFCSLPYNYIAGSSQSHQILSLSYGGWIGQFNHWVSPRSELQGRLSTTIRDFYINPSVLDNVFVRAAGYDQADDQFICSTFLEIRSTKELSKTGLINFV